MTRWWGVVVAGAAATLLFAWLGRLAGVPLETLVTIGAGVAALIWTVVLVTLPWNLYFEARQVLADNAISRTRGIAILPHQDREAQRIARLMRWFALGGHVGTAAVTAVFAYVSGAVTGYYLAGFFLLTTVVRPAAAYVAHLRRRIHVLRRESTHPRADVVTLTETVDSLQRELAEVRRLAVDDLEHLRRTTTAQLTRLESQHRDVRERIDRMARSVEATLDGLSDHQELLTGIRALVRMIRTDAV